MNIGFKWFKHRFLKLTLYKREGFVAILTYHGLVESITHPRLQRNFHTINQFEAQIEFLKSKKYRFLSASELIYYTEHPDEIRSQKMICVTFDDGYQNNLEAIAILKKYNLPGIFFLTTAVINSKKSIWTVNLSLLILEGDISGLHYKQRYYELSTSEQRNALFQIIRMEIKEMNAFDRRSVFVDIENQFPEGEIERLIRKNPCFKMLTWDEIRSVQDEKIQFHSHGHLHEIHHENQSLDVLLSEIKDSKEIIEANIKREVFLFAYPNGNFTAKSFSIFEKVGFKGALKLGDNKYDGSDYRFSVSRLTPNGKLLKFKNQILFK